MEAWQGVLKGIEEKVNQQYGFQSSLPNGSSMAWVPMIRLEDEESKPPPSSLSVTPLRERRGESL
jgi:hypothetical protein